MNNLETDFNDQTTIVEASKHKSIKLSFLLILLAFSFYLVSIFAAMYVGATYLSPLETKDAKMMALQSANLDKASQTPTTSPDASPMPSITTLFDDWKTYTNETYGFSFKHPKDLIVKSSESAPYDQYQMVYMGEKQRKSGRTQSSLSDGFIFYVSVRGKSTIEDEAEKTYNGAKQNCYEDSQLHDISNTTIDGKDAKTYYVTNCMGDYTEHFVANNGQVFEITQIYVGDEPEYSEYKKTTEQILSTFTFAQ